MNLRRRSYLGESDILSGKVWASSGDLEWIKKAISEFYYGSTITLTPISEKEWSVSNSKRVIDKVQVIKIRKNLSPASVAKTWVVANTDGVWSQA